MEGLLGLKGIFTYEDHNPATGIMPPIALLPFAARVIKERCRAFGVKEYGKSGETEELLKAEKLDVGVDGRSDQGRDEVSVGRDSKQ